MTTVDVYVQEQPDSPSVLSFHNGLFGPASTVMNRLYDARTSGAVVHASWLLGDGYPAHLLVVPGFVLQRILKDVSPEGGYTGSATAEQLRRFIDAMDVTGMYWVKCTEF